jgi:hypothetical protein
VLYVKGHGRHAYSRLILFGLRQGVKDAVTQTACLPCEHAVCHTLTHMLLLMLFTFWGGLQQGGAVPGTTLLSCLCGKVHGLGEEWLCSCMDARARRISHWC